MPLIAANNSLKNRLCSDILSGRLSHAYIIEGAPGTGKHLLAMTVSAALSCKNIKDENEPLPCGHCINCRKIFGGIMPDVTVISRENGKSSISIEQSRQIRSDVRIYPNELENRIYIIEDADKMTTAAQNALLLTLEEPPSYAVFLLLCEHSDLLLETVRSRAPVMRTEPVPLSELDAWLCNFAPESITSEANRLKRESLSDYREILTAANGGIGSAIELLSPKYRAELLEKRKQVRLFVASVLDGKGDGVLDVLSDFPQKDRNEVCDRMGLICIAVRDLILIKKDENAPLLFYSDREEAEKLAFGKSIQVLLSFSDACDAAQNAIQRNANIRLTLFNLVTGVTVR